MNANGSTQIAGIKLAKDGQPSSKPVQVQFSVAQNEQAMTGEVQKAIFTVGRAVINMNGTYQASGPTTAINLKVNGDGVPIDDLEAFLPARGSAPAARVVATRGNLDHRVDGLWMERRTR